VLHAARWKYRTQKITILAPSDNFVRLYLRSWGMYWQSGKNLLNVDTCSTCPHNMVNFSLLTIKIGSGVWGTPANFNGFGVLAALLHGTPVVGVSQTLRRWTEGAIYIFGRAAITLGIGPHSRWWLAVVCCSQRFDESTGVYHILDRHFTRNLNAETVLTKGERSLSQ